MSVLTELIVISVTPELSAALMLVAPDARNLKSPDPRTSDPLANCVTVLVSVLSISIVLPLCDTATFPPRAFPPVIVTSPDVNDPEEPPLSLVTVLVAS